MRQLLVLAIAVIYAATPYARSPGDGAAPGTTFRITTVQASMMPQGIDTPTIVEAPQQQQRGTQEQAKKEFWNWNSPWLWLAVGILGTIMAIAPYVVVLRLIFRTGRSFKTGSIDK